MKLTNKPVSYPLNTRSKGTYVKVLSVEEAIRFFASLGIVFTAETGYREPLPTIHAPTIPTRQ